MKNRVFDTVFSGLAGALFTGVISILIALRFGNTSFNIIIDGEKVKVTPIEYQALLDENEKLKEDCVNLSNELLSYKELIESYSNYDKTADIIDKAQLYLDRGRTEEAIILLKNSPIKNSDIENLYEEYALEYNIDVMNNVENLIRDHKIDEAKTLLERALTLVPDKSIICAKIEEIEAIKPTKLSDLPVSSSRHFSNEDEYSHKDTIGNNYSPNNLFSLSYYQSYGYVKCPLNSKYSYLKGEIAIDSGSKDSSGRIEILIADDDGNYTLIYESPNLNRSKLPYEIENIPLENKQWLEIRYHDDNFFGGLTVLLSNFILYP